MACAFQRAKKEERKKADEIKSKTDTNSLSCQNTCLSSSFSPEEDAQDVGYEQHQTHSGGEAVAVAAPLDLLVLWHIGQGSPEHHYTGRQPGQQCPWALYVLLLQNYLCIHHTVWRSGVSRGSSCCTWEAATWKFTVKIRGVQRSYQWWMLWGNLRPITQPETNIPQRGQQQ